MYGSGNSRQAGGGVLGGLNACRICQGIGFSAEFDHTTAAEPPAYSTPEMNVLFGPRYDLPVSSSSRFAPFLDGLIGIDRFHNEGQAYTWVCDSHTAFARVDGGVDISLMRRLSLRVQAGYLGPRLTFSTYGLPPNPTTTFAGRFVSGAGLVFRFQEWTSGAERSEGRTDQVRRNSRIYSQVIRVCGGQRRD